LNHSGQAHITGVKDPKKTKITRKPQKPAENTTDGK
jgi:hypothetical protein